VRVILDTDADTLSLAWGPAGPTINTIGGSQGMHRTPSKPAGGAGAATARAPSHGNVGGQDTAFHNSVTTVLREGGQAADDAPGAGSGAAGGVISGIGSIGGGGKDNYNAWGVAFKHLFRDLQRASKDAGAAGAEATHLFPAIALHDRDDEVRIRAIPKTALAFNAPPSATASSITASSAAASLGGAMVRTGTGASAGLGGGGGGGASSAGGGLGSNAAIAAAAKRAFKLSVPDSRSEPQHAVAPGAPAAAPGPLPQRPVSQLAVMPTRAMVATRSVVASRLLRGAVVARVVEAESESEWAALVNVGTAKRASGDAAVSTGRLVRGAYLAAALGAHVSDHLAANPVLLPPALLKFVGGLVGRLAAVPREHMAVLAPSCEQVLGPFVTSLQRWGAHHLPLAWCTQHLRDLLAATAAWTRAADQIALVPRPRKVHAVDGVWEVTCEGSDSMQTQQYLMALRRVTNGDSGDSHDCNVEGYLVRTSPVARSVATGTPSAAAAQAALFTHLSDIPAGARALLAAAVGGNDGSVAGGVYADAALHVSWPLLCGGLAEGTWSPDAALALTDRLFGDGLTLGPIQTGMVSGRLEDGHLLVTESWLTRPFGGEAPRMAPLVPALTSGLAGAPASTLLASRLTNACVDCMDLSFDGSTLQGTYVDSSGKPHLPTARMIATKVTHPFTASVMTGTGGGKDDDVVATLAGHVELLAALAAFVAASVSSVLSWDSLDRSNDGATLTTCDLVPEWVYHVHRALALPAAVALLPQDAPVPWSTAARSAGTSSPWAEASPFPQRLRFVPLGAFGALSLSRLLSACPAPGAQDADVPMPVTVDSPPSAEVHCFASCMFPGRGAEAVFVLPLPGSRSHPALAAAVVAQFPAVASRAAARHPAMTADDDSKQPEPASEDEGDSDGDSGGAAESKDDPMTGGEVRAAPPPAAAAVWQGFVKAGERMLSHEAPATLTLARKFFLRHGRIMNSGYRAELLPLLLQASSAGPWGRDVLTAAGELVADFTTTPGSVGYAPPVPDRVRPAWLAVQQAVASPVFPPTATLQALTAVDAFVLAELAAARLPSSPWLNMTSTRARTLARGAAREPATAAPGNVHTARLTLAVALAHHLSPRLHNAAGHARPLQALAAVVTDWTGGALSARDVASVPDWPALFAVWVMALEMMPRVAREVDKVMGKDATAANKTTAVAAHVATQARFLLCLEPAATHTLLANSRTTGTPFLYSAEDLKAITDAVGAFVTPSTDNLRNADDPSQGLLPPGLLLPALRFMLLERMLAFATRSHGRQALHQLLARTSRRTPHDLARGVHAAGLWTLAAFTTSVTTWQWYSLYSHAGWGDSMPCLFAVRTASASLWARTLPLVAQLASQVLVTRDVVTAAGTTVTVPQHLHAGGVGLQVVNALIQSLGGLHLVDTTGGHEGTIARVVLSAVVPALRQALAWCDAVQKLATAQTAAARRGGSDADPLLTSATGSEAVELLAASLLPPVCRPPSLMHAAAATRFGLEAVPAEDAGPVSPLDAVHLHALRHSSLVAVITTLGQATHSLARLKVDNLHTDPPVGEAGGPQWMSQRCEPATGDITSLASALAEVVQGEVSRCLAVLRRHEAGDGAVTLAPYRGSGGNNAHIAAGHITAGGLGIPFADERTTCELRLYHILTHLYEMVAEHGMPTTAAPEQSADGLHPLVEALFAAPASLLPLLLTMVLPTASPHADGWWWRSLSARIIRRAFRILQIVIPMLPPRRFDALAASMSGGAVALLEGADRVGVAVDAEAACRSALREVGAAIAGDAPAAEAEASESPVRPTPSIQLIRALLDQIGRVHGAPSTLQVPEIPLDVTADLRAAEEALQAEVQWANAVMHAIAPAPAPSAGASGSTGGGGLSRAPTPPRMGRLGSDVREAVTRLDFLASASSRAPRAEDISSLRRSPTPPASATSSAVVRPRSGSPVRVSTPPRRVDAGSADSVSAAPPPDAPAAVADPVPVTLASLALPAPPRCTLTPSAPEVVAAIASRRRVLDTALVALNATSRAVQQSHCFMPPVGKMPALHRVLDAAIADAAALLPSSASAADVEMTPAQDAAAAQVHKYLHAAGEISKVVATVLTLAPTAAAAATAVEMHPSSVAFLVSTESVCLLRLLLDEGAPPPDRSDPHGLLPNRGDGSWHSVVSDELTQAVRDLHRGHDAALEQLVASTGSINGSVVGRVEGSRISFAAFASRSAPDADDDMRGGQAPLWQQLNRRGVPANLVQRLAGLHAVTAAAARDAMSCRGVAALAVCGGHRDWARPGAIVQRADGTQSWLVPRDDEIDAAAHDQTLSAQAADAFSSAIPVTRLRFVEADGADVATQQVAHASAAAPAPAASIAQPVASSDDENGGGGWRSNKATPSGDAKADSSADMRALAWLTTAERRAGESRRAVWQVPLSMKTRRARCRFARYVVANLSLHGLQVLQAHNAVVAAMNAAGGIRDPTALQPVLVPRLGTPQLGVAMWGSGMLDTASAQALLKGLFTDRDGRMQLRSAVDGAIAVARAAELTPSGYGGTAGFDLWADMPMPYVGLGLVVGMTMLHPMAAAPGIRLRDDVKSPHAGNADVIAHSALWPGLPLLQDEATKALYTPWLHDSPGQTDMPPGVGIPLQAASLSLLVRGSNGQGYNTRLSADAVEVVDPIAANVLVFPSPLVAALLGLRHIAGTATGLTGRLPAMLTTVLMQLTVPVPPAIVASMERTAPLGIASRTLITHAAHESAKMAAKGAKPAAAVGAGATSAADGGATSAVTVTSGPLAPPLVMYEVDGDDLATKELNTADFVRDCIPATVLSTITAATLTQWGTLDAAPGTPQEAASYAPPADMVVERAVARIALLRALPDWLSSPDIAAAVVAEAMGSNSDSSGNSSGGGGGGGAVDAVDGAAAVTTPVRAGNMVAQLFRLAVQNVAGVAGLRDIATVEAAWLRLMHLLAQVRAVRIRNALEQAHAALTRAHVIGQSLPVIRAVEAALAAAAAEVGNAGQVDGLPRLTVPPLTMDTVDRPDDLAWPPWAGPPPVGAFALGPATAVPVIDVGPLGSGGAVLHTGARLAPSELPPAVAAALQLLTSGTMWLHKPAEASDSKAAEELSARLAGPMSSHGAGDADVDIDPELAAALALSRGEEVGPPASAPAPAVPATPAAAPAPVAAGSSAPGASGTAVGTAASPASPAQPPSAECTMLMDMGFKREWCEFALAKTGNRVENAANYLFEHGDSMDRRIAEADAARRREVERARAQPAAGASGLLASVAVDRIAALSRRGVDRALINVVMSQVVDMGFPPEFATLALGHLPPGTSAEEAMMWILSHSDELAEMHVAEARAAPVATMSSALASALGTAEPGAAAPAPGTAAPRAPQPAFPALGSRPPAASAAGGEGGGPAASGRLEASPAASLTDLMGAVRGGAAPASVDSATLRRALATSGPLSRGAPRPAAPQDGSAPATTGGWRPSLFGGRQTEVRREPGGGEEGLSPAAISESMAAAELLRAHMEMGGDMSAYVEGMLRAAPDDSTPVAKASEASSKPNPAVEEAIKRGAMIEEDARGADGLRTLSGTAEVDATLLVVNSPSRGNFATVGMPDVCLTHGRWYYEVWVQRSNNVFQIGWADAEFRPDAAVGHGVGDCSHSWAVDGNRLRKWHGVNEPFGTQWPSQGPCVIGCAIDMDARVMAFSVNGRFDEPNGVAFVNFNPSTGLYPAATLSAGLVMQINWGGPGRRFRHPPHASFRPIHEAFQTARLRPLGNVHVRSAYPYLPDGDRCMPAGGVPDHLLEDALADGSVESSRRRIARVHSMGATGGVGQGPLDISTNAARYFARSAAYDGSHVEGPRASPPAAALGGMGGGLRARNAGDRINPAAIAAGGAAEVTCLPFNSSPEYGTARYRFHPEFEPTASVQDVTAAMESAAVEALRSAAAPGWSASRSAASGHLDHAVSGTVTAGAIPLAQAWDMLQAADVATALHIVDGDADAPVTPATIASALRRRMYALRAVRASLQLLVPVGAASAAATMAAAEARLRSQLLATGSMLAALHARRAIMALLAAYPAIEGLPVHITHADGRTTTMPIPPLTASLFQRAPSAEMVVIPGVPRPQHTRGTAAAAKAGKAGGGLHDDEAAGDGLESESSGEREQGALSPADQHVLDRAMHWETFIKIMSWRGVAMGEQSVAALAERPAQLLAAKARALAAGSWFDPDWKQLDPSRMNASGVWRFDSRSNLAVSHPLAIVERPLQSALVAEAAIVLRGASTRPQHAALATMLLGSLAEEVCHASAPSYANLAWRGQIALRGTWGTDGADLDGVPGIPPAGLTELLGGSSSTWSDSDSYELPNLGHLVWLSATLMDVAAAARVASLRAVAQDATAPQSPATAAAPPADAAPQPTTAPAAKPPPPLCAESTLCKRVVIVGVPSSALAELRRQCDGDRSAVEVATAGVAPVDSRRACLPIALETPSADGTTATLLVVPASGRLLFPYAIALVSMWAVALRSKNAGLKERAARLCAAVLHELLADVAVVESAQRWVSEQPASDWTSALAVALHEAAAVRRKALKRALRVLPPGRIAHAAALRLAFERTDTPVFSLYLSALLELHTALATAEALCPPLRPGDAVAVALHHAVAEAGRELAHLRLSAGVADTPAAPAAAPTDTDRAGMLVPTDSDSKQPEPADDVTSTAVPDGELVRLATIDTAPEVNVSPVRDGAHSRDADAPWRLLAIGAGFSAEPGNHHGGGSGPLTTPMAGLSGGAVAGDLGGVQWSGAILQRSVPAVVDSARSCQAFRSVGGIKSLARIIFTGGKQSVRHKAATSSASAQPATRAPGASGGAITITRLDGVVPAADASEPSAAGMPDAGGAAPQAAPPHSTADSAHDGDDDTNGLAGRVGGRTAPLDVLDFDAIRTGDGAVPEDVVVEGDHAEPDPVHALNPECAACTFINPDGAELCEVCGSELMPLAPPPAPAPAAAAAAAPDISIEVPISAPVPEAPHPAEAGDSVDAPAPASSSSAPSDSELALQQAVRPAAPADELPPAAAAAPPAPAPAVADAALMADVDMAVAPPVEAAAPSPAASDAVAADVSMAVAPAVEIPAAPIAAAAADAIAAAQAAPGGGESTQQQAASGSDAAPAAVAAPAVQPTPDGAGPIVAADDSAPVRAETASPSVSDSMGEHVDDEEEDDFTEPNCNVQISMADRLHGAPSCGMASVIGGTLHDMPDMLLTLPLQDFARSQVQLGASLRLLALDPVSVVTMPHGDGLEYTVVTVRVAGVLDVPLHNAVIGVDGTYRLGFATAAVTVAAAAATSEAPWVSAAYGLHVREVELLSGAGEQGWSVRYGTSRDWWSPGLVHRFAGAFATPPAALASLCSPSRAVLQVPRTLLTSLPGVATCSDGAPAGCFNVLQQVPWPQELTGGYALPLLLGDSMTLEVELSRGHSLFSVVRVEVQAGTTATVEVPEWADVSTVVSWVGTILGGMGEDPSSDSATCSRPAGSGPLLQPDLNITVRREPTYTVPNVLRPPQSVVGVTVLGRQHLFLLDNSTMGQRLTGTIKSADLVGTEIAQLHPQSMSMSPLPAVAPGIAAALAIPADSFTRISQELSGPMLGPPARDVGVSDAVEGERGGGEMRSLILGTQGFSSGIHYWELKVTACDAGSVMIGVAERPTLDCIGAAAACDLAASAQNGVTVGTLMVHEDLVEGVVEMQLDGATPLRSDGKVSTATRGLRVSALQRHENSTWHGWGFVSHRTSYGHRSERVYGEFVQAGDVVGVRLDADAGVVSFFLDGMKFGEHIVADLGPAFSEIDCSGRTRFQGDGTDGGCLHDPHARTERLANAAPESSTSNPYVRGVRRPLFPCIGLRRSSDRVSLTHKWVSLPGPGTDLAILRLLRQHEAVTMLLSAWHDGQWGDGIASTTDAAEGSAALTVGTKRKREVLREVGAAGDASATAIGAPVALPLLDLHAAALQRLVAVAWLRWQRWAASTRTVRYRRVRARGGIAVEVDTSPAACDAVVRNARLGGSVRTRGVDNVLATTPAGANGRPTGPMHIHTLRAGDRVRVRSSHGRPLDAPEVAVVLGAYRGHLWYQVDTAPAAAGGGAAADAEGGGADLAAGQPAWYWLPDELAALAKIDSAPAPSPAAVTPTAAADAATPTAASTAGNSVRRASSHHEVHADRASMAAADEAVAMVADLATFAAAAGVPTAAGAAASRWRAMRMSDAWLVSVIDAAASTSGNAPENVSAADLLRVAKVSATALAAAAASAAPPEAHAEWFHTEVGSAPWCAAVLARACLLVAFNSDIAVALPLASLHPLDEPGAAFPGLGVLAGSNEVAGRETLAAALAVQAACASSSSGSTAATTALTRARDLVTRMSARRWTGGAAGLGLGPLLRSHRGLILHATKTTVWELLAGATSTFTNPSPDEYEDPREVRAVRITRGPKVQPAAVAQLPTPEARLKRTITGQLLGELRPWTDAALRRSYVAKNHGGQRRAFKIKMVGEGVNDYGGPYRAIFEALVDELQVEGGVPGQAGAIPVLPDEHPMLIPALAPTPNRRQKLADGDRYADRFTLNPAAAAGGVRMRELVAFVGRMMGVGLRHGLQLGLQLVPPVWGHLVAQPPTLHDLRTVDASAWRELTAELSASAGMGDSSAGGAESDVDMATPAPTPTTPAAAGGAGSDEIDVERWMAELSDGHPAELVPGGAVVKLPAGREWRRLRATLAAEARVHEAAASAHILAHGMGAVLPQEAMAVFTPRQLELAVAGAGDVDVVALKRATEFDTGVSPTDAHVQWLWEVLAEATPSDRVAFLRFVIARSRLPANVAQLNQPIRIMRATGEQATNPDGYLIHSSTCHSQVTIPPYTSKETLRRKVLFSIHNAPNMDADFVLHAAEGWADT